MNTMPPVRILHLITSLNTGGAEMSLARLVSGMNRDKFESRVVSLIPLGPVGGQIQQQGIPVESLEMPPGQATLAGFVKLLRLLRAYRPDILQTWLYHADLLGLLAGKLAGVPVIAWNVRSSEMDFSKYRRLSGLVARLCALLSGLPQVVVVNSQAGERHHERAGYHPRHWQVIPNGVDTTLFAPNQAAGSLLRAQWNIPAGERVIGLVGRLDPQKDHPSFLKAAALASQTFPSARFVCVGGGPAVYLSELKALAMELGLEERVIWTGARGDMPAVYNALDLLALSSAYGEGFPNVVAEAMACGVPCVVTEVGDAAQIVGNCGVSVPPGDPSALTEGLLRLLLLPDSERESHGGCARQRIQANFSLENMLARYEMLYFNLASEK
jgi:glycosyltransferase involved in cell wall biosynthesis